AQAVFSPDSKRLAVATTTMVGVKPVEEGAIRVWDIAAGKEIATLKGSVAGASNDNLSLVANLAFSPDGKRLAGADGREIKVWDTDSGKVLVTIPSPAPAGGVVFSPNGRRFAGVIVTWDTGQRKGALKVWDAATGKEVLDIPEGPHTFAAV